MFSSNNRETRHIRRKVKVCLKAVAKLVTRINPGRKENDEAFVSNMPSAKFCVLRFTHFRFALGSQDQSPGKRNCFITDR